MIRILHSVSNLDRGGIETMLMNYYRHIDRDKVQFDFVCNKLKPGAYDKEVTDMGARIFHSPGLHPLHYPQYIRFFKQLACQHPSICTIEALQMAAFYHPVYGLLQSERPQTAATKRDTVSRIMFQHHRLMHKSQDFARYGLSLGNVFLFT